MTFFSLRATFLDFQNIKIDGKFEIVENKNWNKNWKKIETKWKWTNPRRSWKSPDSLLASPLVSWWFLDPRSRGPWDRSWCAKSPPHSVSLAWCLPRRSSGIWPSATCRRSSGKNSTQLLTPVQPRTKPQGMKTSMKTSKWSLSRHSQITSGMLTTSGFFGRFSGTQGS